MPRPDVSDERKREILKAALNIFNSKGFTAARMEDIAREAKLSVGAVYWYYKSKDDVILAIMDKVIADDMAVMKQLLNETGTVRQRLIKYLQEGAQEGIVYLPLTYELYTLAQRNAKVRHHIQKHIAHYHDALAEIIQQGIQRGEIRKVNSQVVATTLSALYEGALELAMLDSKNIDVTKTLTQSVNIIFDGIAT
ncbi:MAG: TetR/AcrR family transcriptional regulator [Anaerolineales bacterium]|nr:TetR/AcrR family transcriptional regulator [Anaerolineales bacterium]